MVRLASSHSKTHYLSATIDKKTESMKIFQIKNCELYSEVSKIYDYETIILKSIFLSL